VSFTATSSPIGKDGSIETAEDAVDEIFGGAMVDVFLGGGVVEDAIETEPHVFDLL